MTTVLDHHNKIIHYFFKWTIIATSCLVIASCAITTTPSNQPPVITTTPDIELDPNLNTPLAGLLTLTTDVPSRITIEIKSDKKSWAINLKQFSTNHSIPVLGLRPDTTHSIKIRATTKQGATTVYKNALTVITDPLPDGFPAIKVISQPDKMEPGYTLIEVIPEGSENKEFGALIVIVDSAGEVVWYMTGSRFTDVRQLADGNLIFIVGFRARIMNMTGDIIKEWQARRSKHKNQPKRTVLTQGFHHELFPMENGNFLTLSIEGRNIPNYPTSTTDAKAPKQDAFVVGDRIVEFKDDGTIVKSWSMLKLLQPQRVTFSSLGGYWDMVFQNKKTKDWSHGNAVTHQPEDDSIIVTLRHQDTTVKFSRKTGKIIWILAPHENWDKNRFYRFLLKPKTDDAYFFPYHHHAHEVMPNGNLMIYDNGSYGKSPFSPPKRDKTFSRAVEYKIDEKTRRAEIVWQHGQNAETVYYSGALGDADYLPKTNNVLITHGSLATDKKINSAAILEVTHTVPAKEVFNMRVYDDAPEEEGGWRVYRAERIPDLYPQ